MRLNDPLVTFFMYKDKKYDIDLSFDNVLDVFDVMRNKDLRDYEKAEIGLTLLIGEDFEPSVMIELWNYVFGEFIQFNVERTVEYDIKGNPMPVVEDDDEEYLDLEQDAEYIFASFRQAYGINLYDEQGKMTWAEFKALLHGLPNDTIMKQIVQIRSWEPSSGESEKHKQSMRKLQRVYALREVDE